jgi:DNA polymerase III gamma/tau subunit
MEETQLTFFDAEITRQYQRQQQDAELAAQFVKLVGPKFAQKWYDKINRDKAKLHAVLQEAERNRTPKMQARLERISAEMRATWKPYLQEECVLLGIEPNASKKDLRNAYRRKARKLHPDVGGNAEDFKHLQDAYHKLLKLAPRE